jgi:hypothetical protein
MADTLRSNATLSVQRPARRHASVPAAPMFRRPPGIVALLSEIESDFDSYHATLSGPDRVVALRWLCIAITNRTARRARVPLNLPPAQAPAGILSALAAVDERIDDYLDGLPCEADRVAALCWLPWWAKTRRAIEADLLHPQPPASQRCATASALASLIGGAP